MSRSIEFQIGFCEMNSRGVVVAIGCFERAHPFAGVFVFDLGEAFEIGAGDGVELDGGFIAADFRNGGGKMHDGIVGPRDGAVAGCAGGDHVDVDGNFFAGLDADILNFAVGTITRPSSLMA